MAKGKNLNPADAYRKAQRKKELKKNKTERAKARDFALVKKDTRDLEDEIKKLEGSAELSASDKSRLTNLKNELSKIMEKKDEYVKEHPEQRKLVYRPHKQEKMEDQMETPLVEQKRNLFNKHGLPRHPERSIYYDPVMNPYGVPPPGMPYIERPLTADEVDSGEDVGDEDIVMPEGPPPGAGLDDPESGSDDDIPMPEGPPPSNVPSSSRTLDLFRNGTEVMSRADQNDQAPPSAIPPPFPPPLPQIPLTTPSFILPPPPPPPSFYGDVYTTPPGIIPPPPPPPGFFPRRIQSAAVIQDPLSSIPHQTYQAHRARQLPPGHPSLPQKPSSDALGTISARAAHAGAIITAEPELRDLKKEATAFVPTSLKRKKPLGVPSSAKINAAPSVNVGLEATSPQARPDLVGVLKSQLGSAPPSSGQASDKEAKAPIVKEKDDYQKFVDEMNDLLGPPGSS
ncbi:WW domain binding protein 11-domain-containing protein [Butyriboletus roseoflavus]|nr:WW domain binding protein 11-domain-containing protein [Butyriboletus roseoflavus]